MLDAQKLHTELPVQGLGDPLYIYEVIGSTNDRCLELAEAGAPEGTLVLADQQQHGRGRGARTWFSPAESGIAMSLLLRPGSVGQDDHAAYNMLGAVALVKALEGLGLSALIKWPNDVLLEGKKVAGVLTEAAWQGQTLEYVVIGIGVNVRPSSLPPAGQLDFPAGYLDGFRDEPVERESLVAGILHGLRSGLELIGSGELLPWVEGHLAYREREVRIDLEGKAATGRIVGLSPSGMLRVRLDDGYVSLVGTDVHLRTVD
jgi:BirA family biotin operon repressor/biotin-[acetyl-CoA-carboxylase] ligase